jgi:hypothetical protein
MRNNKSRIHIFLGIALSVIFSLFSVSSEGAQKQSVPHTETPKRSVQEQPAKTLEVDAEGVSAIGKVGRSEARQAALKDALQQAALSVEAQVMSSEHMDMDTGKAQIQSLSVRPTQEITHYSILREWEDQGIYHVVVRAEVGQEKSKGAENTTSVVAPVGPHTPKKKIAFVKFDVANSIQLDDISNIHSGFPAELAKRMELVAGFLSEYYGQSTIQDASEIQKNADVRHIAEESGAQFVVAGKIVDAGVIPSQGIFQGIFGHDSRNLEIELSVYDGLTGTRIALRYLDEHAQGELTVGRDKPFGSKSFFATDMGQAANRLMDAVIRDLAKTLGQLPFSAHIVRIEGKKVFMDAGNTSQLMPGDKLVAYVRNSGHPIVGLGGVVLGETENVVATVTLVQVYPRFSIGELSDDATKLGIKVGDIVRFELPDKK